MAKALEEQWTLPASHSLSFDDRLGLLLDRELTWRDNKRLERLRKQAKLKYSGACLENLDRCPGRGLDERQLATLASGDWIRQHHNLLLTGPTGVGKSWLACALGNQACRQGYSTLRVCTPRLLEQLRIAYGDGSFGRTLQQLGHPGSGRLGTGAARGKRRVRPAGSDRRPRRLTANCQSITGMAGSTIRQWPTPYWIDWCTARIGS
jgi:hypothetical protein